MASSGGSTINEEAIARQGVQAYENEKANFIKAIVKAIGNTQDQALRALFFQPEKVAEMGLTEIYDLAMKAVQNAKDPDAAYSLENILIDYSRTKAVNHDGNYIVQKLFISEMERKQQFEQQKDQLDKEIKDQQAIIEKQIVELEHARHEFVEHENKSIQLFTPEAKKKYADRLAEIDQAINILKQQKEKLVRYALPPAVQSMQLVAPDQIDKKSIEPYILDKIIIREYKRMIDRDLEKPRSFWSKIFGWKSKSEKAKEKLQSVLQNILLELNKPTPNLTQSAISEAISYLTAVRPQGKSKEIMGSLLQLQKNIASFHNAPETLAPQITEEMAKMKKVLEEDNVNERLAQIRREAKEIEADAIKIKNIVNGMNAQLSEQAKQPAERVLRAEAHLELKKGNLIHGACAKKQEKLQAEKKLTDEALTFLNNAICVSKGQKDLDNIFHAKTRDATNTAAKFIFHRLKKAWSVSGNPNRDPIVGLQIQRRAAAAASFFAYAIAKDRAAGPGHKLDERERNNIKTALFIYGQLISTNLSLDEIIKNAANEPYASDQIKGTPKKGSTFQKILDEFSSREEEVIGQADFVRLTLDQIQKPETTSARESEREYQALLDFHDPAFGENPEGNLVNFTEEKAPKLLESPSHLLTDPFEQKIFPGRKPPIEIKNQKMLHQMYTNHLKTQQASEKIVGMIEGAFQKLQEKPLALEEMQRVQNTLLDLLKKPTQKNEKYSAQIAVRANLTALVYATARELNQKLEDMKDKDKIEKIKNQITYLFQLYEQLVLTGDSIDKILKDNKTALDACQGSHEESFNKIFSLLRDIINKPEMRHLLSASEAGGLVNEANVDALFKFHASGTAQSFYHESKEKKMEKLDDQFEKFKDKLHEKRVEKLVHRKQEMLEEKEKKKEEAKKEKTPEEIKDSIDKATLAVLDDMKKDYQEKIAKLEKLTGSDRVAMDEKKEIMENTHLSEYYYTIIRKLTAEIMTGQIIHYTDKVQDTSLTPAQQAMLPIQAASGAFSFVGADSAVNALAAVVNFHEEKKKAEANRYLARAFTDPVEATKFIEELARKLTMQQKLHLEQVKNLTSEDLLGRAAKYAAQLMGSESLSAVEQYAFLHAENFLAAIKEFGEAGLELSDPVQRQEWLKHAIALTVGDSVYAEIEGALHPTDPETEAELVHLETQFANAAKATAEEHRKMEEAVSVEVEQPKPKQMEPGKAPKAEPVKEGASAPVPAHEEPSPVRRMSGPGS